MIDVSAIQKSVDGFRLVKTVRSVPFVFAAILALLAVFDPGAWVGVVEFAIRAFLGTVPFILFAILLLGLLKATGAEILVGRAFEGRELQAIFLAALVGGLAPFCSCEVIPFIAGLLALGAPLSAVMAFWLSSPLIDPPSFIVTGSVLGWTFAVSKAVFAVLIGLSGGLVIKALSGLEVISTPLKKNFPGSRCNRGKSKTTFAWKFWQEPERVTIFKQEGQSNFWFLSKWLALAYLLEALLVTYVPASFIVQLVGGDGLLPIAVAALVGAPAYLNSFAAIPLVDGLVGHGMTVGAAMSFMIAGSVSSIPAMTAVFSLVKNQIFALYLIFGATGAIMFGAVYQYLVAAWLA